MDPGEQVEANKGYRGHPNKIKCPQNVGNLAEKRSIQGSVRVPHKMLNRWLKKWEIVSQVYHHNIMQHGNVFRVVLFTIPILAVWPVLVWYWH